MVKKKVCIIGAGIGGLSLSLRLAKLGCQVDLFEQNKTIGGKANLIEIHGFRFDTGPSLITMPFVIKDLFVEAGEQIEDHIKFKKLDILCKYFFVDGTTISSYPSTDRFAKEIETNTVDDTESVVKYFNYCKKIYELSAELFLFNSFSEPSTFFNKTALKTLLQINKLDTNRTMHKANSTFFNDPKTIQIFDRYATYNGSNPFCAPATLNIIQHVEYNLGGYICEKGVYQIPKALSAIAEKLGVKIFTRSKISKITLENKSVNGIEINGEKKNYDIVVSNADVNYTYKKLLNDNSSRLAKRYSKLEKSSSAIVFYWGIKGSFPELEIHNILFSNYYKKEFENIFINKTIPDDPTVYIYISSKFNPSDAPEGYENWFVMINTPPDENHDWDKLVVEAKERIQNKINALLKVDVKNLITFEKILTPKLLEESTSSSNGSIYGISSNNKMAAFLRQQNRSKDYKGLYFCGGSAHPGGGIPLVTLSAKITADLIKKHELN